ncbi:protein phosphatase [Methanolinea mesophila]|uniref:PP2C family protein-serine/threonine phosphatase n=1 Tax=Methanolinea mesophila TaxID=547055 RepID=UPI001AE3239D|nr:protein phosphatase 2C domain-containing protein [Methanolinea mesophila]MBP1927502.1 protein phosphatase [Methanolinea mesophila]
MTNPDERPDPEDLVTMDGEAAGVSCRGPRERNEDRILISRIGPCLLLAVADGVGGARGGDIAASLALSVLEQAMTRCLAERHDFNTEEIVKNSFRLAHHAVKARAREGLEGMGTTLVAAVIHGNSVVIANTGDSRAYVIQDHEMFHTRDHSVIQTLRERNMITGEEESTHPLRSCITQCLGGPFGVDTYRMPLYPGALVLLSSDGFHNTVTESRLQSLSRTGKPSELVRELIGESLKSAGDNTSLIIYRHRPV